MIQAKYMVQPQILDDDEEKNEKEEKEEQRSSFLLKKIGAAFPAEKSSVLVGDR